MGVIIDVRREVSRIHEREYREWRQGDRQGFAPHQTNLHYPVVRFQTHTGQVVDAVSSIGTNYPYPVGQQIMVNYDPDNPQSVAIGDSKSATTWLPFTIFGFVGLIIMLVGALFFFRSL